MDLVHISMQRCFNRYPSWAWPLDGIFEYRAGKKYQSWVRLNSNNSSYPTLISHHNTAGRESLNGCQKRAINLSHRCVHKFLIYWENMHTNQAPFVLRDTLIDLCPSLIFTFGHLSNPWRRMESTTQSSCLVLSMFSNRREWCLFRAEGCVQSNMGIKSDYPTRLSHLWSLEIRAHISDLERCAQNKIAEAGSLSIRISGKGSLGVVFPVSFC